MLSRTVVSLFNKRGKVIDHIMAGYAFVVAKEVIYHKNDSMLTLW